MATKVIAGRINADGSIAGGSGFYVRPLGSGAYIVEFDSALLDVPTIVSKQNYKSWDEFDYPGGNTLDNTVLVAVDKKGFKLITGASSGVRVDRNFSFFAAGAAAGNDDIPAILWGDIDGSAAIHSGSGGFGVKKEAAGTYEINFSPFLKELSGVVLTQNHPKWDAFTSTGGKTLDNAVILAADNEAVKYLTGNGEGTKEFRNCSFVAAGTGAAPPPRLLFGNVNADSTLYSKGSGGYTVKSIDTGTYVITFDVEFKAGPPAVVLTQNYPTWNDFREAGRDTRDNCVLVAVDNIHAKIITGDNVGTRQNRNFGFLIVG